MRFYTLYEKCMKLSSRSYLSNHLLTLNVFYKLCDLLRVCDKFAYFLHMCLFELFVYVFDSMFTNTSACGSVSTRTIEHRTTITLHTRSLSLLVDVYDAHPR